MGNLSLLKEFVELALEGTGPAGPQSPFVVRGPVKKVTHKGHSDEYAIYREFPVVLPPEMLSDLRVGPEELHDGILEGENEVIIEVEVHYRRSTFKGSREQPPDPDEFEIEDWSVVAFNGFELSKEDAKALKDYLGDLTGKEYDHIQEAWFDRGHAEPDYPEPDDYDYDDRF